MTFILLDEQFHAGRTETITQNINAFNAASGGTIRLTSESLMGDFSRETFFKEIEGLARHRNPTSKSSVNAKSLDMGLNTSVKVDGAVGPVLILESQIRRVGSDNGEMSFILGQQAGAAQVEQQLNDVIASLVASTSRVSELNTTIAPEVLNHGGLNQLNALYGDKSGNVNAYLMHSKPWHDLIGNSITDNVYQIGSLAIMKGTTGTLNRMVIVTDSPALESEAGFHTLGLTPNAAVIKDSEQSSALIERIGGNENIQYRFQAEYAYNISVKGYTWRDTIKSPDIAALGNSSNWSKTATSHKSLAAAMLVTK